MTFLALLYWRYSSKQVPYIGAWQCVSSPQYFHNGFPRVKGDRLPSVLKWILIKSCKLKGTLLLRPHDPSSCHLTHFHNDYGHKQIIFDKYWPLSKRLVICLLFVLTCTSLTKALCERHESAWSNGTQTTDAQRDIVILFVNPLCWLFVSMW